MGRNLGGSQIRSQIGSQIKTKKGKGWRRRAAQAKTAIHCKFCRHGQLARAVLSTVQANNLKKKNEGKTKEIW